MHLKLILRLIWALVLATLAAIYTQLIPATSFSLLLLRVLLTVLSALIGFLVFPTIAEKISRFSLRLFNLIVRRVSIEVFTQLTRSMLPSFNSNKLSNTVLSSAIILDTSAIIDGRVLDIVKTGFISGLIIIPKFVLTELQLVSDSSDDIKRARGRRGFEIIEELKKIKGIKIEIWEREVNGKNVDEKILSLAKNINGKILTTDFNLNKVASVSNLKVLNMNDLANALKVVAIPGEKIALKLTHIGKDSSQGVGYLQDGTMVVVSHAAEEIGKTINIEVTKTLQSPTGRIIFAKINS